MPEKDFWETLFDIPGILDGLKIGRAISSAVEVGCGYGTFTVPVAQRIVGTLHTFDIEPEMIAATEARLRMASIGNVVVARRDVIAEGFGLPAGSVDAVLLFNILHGENPVELLRASAELLAPNGRVLVIHWRSDVPTPRGPDLSIRPRPEQVASWGREAGLVSIGSSAILPPWHYGMALRRLKADSDNRPPHAADAGHAKDFSMQLPDRPNLPHLRDQAKKLVRAGTAPTLADAQFQIAQQYGFASWPKLAQHVKSRESGQLRQAIDANDLARVDDLLKSQPELRQVLLDDVPLMRVAQPNRIPMMELLVRHGGAAETVRRDPVRRNREGPSGRIQCPAAGARRRAHY